VLDSACAFTKNLEKPISRELRADVARRRVRQLVILSDDGFNLLADRETTPATGQNARLLEFRGRARYGER